MGFARLALPRLACANQGHLQVCDANDSNLCGCARILTATFCGLDQTRECDLPSKKVVSRTVLPCEIEPSGDVRGFEFIGKPNPFCLIST
jgi:hypothetical protein